MVGRFGEAPQKIRAQGARTPSPPTPPRVTPTATESTSRRGRVFGVPEASVSGGVGGESCSPDPYLLRVDEARDQRLVARLSGGGGRCPRGCRWRYEGGRGTPPRRRPAPGCPPSGARSGSGRRARLREAARSWPGRGERVQRAGPAPRGGAGVP